MASGGSYYIVNGQRITEAEYLKRKSERKQKPKSETKQTSKSGKPEDQTTNISEE